jgi:propionyl-CoA carboxylase alpha chain
LYWRSTYLVNHSARREIIEVAKQLNVDAIHPGYGFLSENASFAELAEKNGIIFIGPKTKAMK